VWVWPFLNPLDERPSGKNARLNGALAIVVGVGFIGRLAFLWLHPYDGGAEMVRLGVTFGQMGFLGNPYIVPTGPSAHVAPLYPILLGLLYRAFGTEHLMLLGAGILASTATAMSCILLPWLASNLGLSRRAGVAAGAILAVPLFTWIELSGSWETSFTTLALILLVGTQAADLTKRRLSWQFGLGRGATLGCGVFAGSNPRHGVWRPDRIHCTHGPTRGLSSDRIPRCHAPGYGPRAHPVYYPQLETPGRVDVCSRQLRPGTLHLQQ
jgi:hypothetical protein